MEVVERIVVETFVAPNEKPPPPAVLVAVGAAAEPKPKPPKAPGLAGLVAGADT